MWWQVLLWVYAANATLLIVHEIDSAYWREWNLFGLAGGIGLFVTLHVPLVGLILWGLLEVQKRSWVGLLLAGACAAGGFFAVIAHTYFLRKGRPEFRHPVSIAVLAAMGLASAAEAMVIALAAGE